jgi:hypothetical protein
MVVRVMALDHRLQRVLDIALGDVGESELPVGSGSNRSPKIDGYRPQWKRDELAKRDRELGRKVKGDAWCAWAVTAWWYRGLGFHPLGRQIGGCYELALEAKRRGLWVPLPDERDTWHVRVAYPGAAFVQLDKPPEAGRSAGHTGLISGTDDTGWWASTVEGNSGDAVREGRRQLWAGRMRGLVVPLGPEHAWGEWPLGLRRGEDTAAMGTR